MKLFWITCVTVFFFQVFDASVLNPAEAPDGRRSKRLTTFGGASSIQNSNQNQAQNNQNKKPLHQPCRTDYECGTTNSECRTNSSSYNPTTMMCYCKENYEEIDNECSGSNRNTSISYLATLILLILTKFNLIF